MRNLFLTNDVLDGHVYMVEMENGETNSYRILCETPTHFIFSFSTDEGAEVLEKAKKDVIGIYEVKEWWTSKENK